MADVFISYARTDKALVAPLVAAIEGRGWSVWWDPEIAPGQEFDEQIAAALGSAPCRRGRLDARFGRLTLGSRRSTRSSRPRHPRPGETRGGDAPVRRSGDPHHRSRWLGR
jgi:hypothetical protein